MPKHGFFYVKNHGISQIIIDDAFEASKRFSFEPIKKKMLVSKDKFHRGYLPIGTTRYPGKAADLKDSFDVGIELPLSHPDVVAGLSLHGPNQWPNINGFRAAAENVFKIRFDNSVIDRGKKRKMGRGGE